MTVRYELHVTGEFKHNLKVCKRRGLPNYGRLLVSYFVAKHWRINTVPTF